ncbi:MAG: aromatic amino acid transport family protein [Chlamydiota bacterium]
MDFRTVSGTLFIIGTTVGGGMLGIPLVTANAGFWPAVVVSGFVALFMCLTGLLFLEVVLAMPKEANLVTIARGVLGKKCAIFVGVTFVFLYYCLLSAYCSIGAPLIAQIVHLLTGAKLSSWVAGAIFVLLFGGVVTLGIRWVNYFNYFALALMGVSYLALLSLGWYDVDSIRLEEQNFTLAIWAFPVLFSAFGYHNIIPSLGAYFSYDKKILRRSIVFGSCSVFLIYVFWQALILGAIPKELLLDSFTSGDSSKGLQYLQKGGIWISYFASCFGFFAIVTSFFGVAFSMIDFLGDALRQKREGKSRCFLAFVTLFPPFLIASIDPTIFLRALELAGGVGEAILNGALPVLLIWSLLGQKGKRGQVQYRNKPLLTGLLLISFGVILLEGYMLLSG